MQPDFYFYNSLAQFLAMAALMVVFFVLRRSIGSRSMFIGFELLLFTVLARRIDDLGVYFGIDVLNRPALAVLSWVVIAILYAAFFQVFRRRATIRHIVEKLRTSPAYVQALSHDDEELTRARTL